MRSQPLGICKTLLMIKVQLSTSYNLLKLSGYPSRRELLDLSKKLWRSVHWRAFLQERSQRNGKKIASRGKSLHEILTGPTPGGKR